MGTYVIPAGPVPVSATWQDHRNRNPPSSEPGTDYACAYGTPIVAAEAGIINSTKTSTSGGTGRYSAVALDDGNTVRYLHLSQVIVGVGQRVGRGEIIGISGASGNGSEWGYGAHVHVSQWPGHGPYGSAATVDFQLSVGDLTPPAPPPLPPEDDMTYYLLALSTGPAGLAIGGYIYAYNPGQPIKLLSSQEWNQVDFWRSRGFPVPVTEWQGVDVESAIASNGMFELTAGPGTPATGRVVFGSDLVRYPSTLTVNPAVVTESQARKIGDSVAAVVGRHWVPGVVIGAVGVLLLGVNLAVTLSPS